MNRVSRLIVVVVSTFLIGLLISTYLKGRPHKVESFEGVKLGESKDEVYYQLGVPTNVSFPPEYDKTLKGYSLREAKPQEIQQKENGVKDFDEWSYQYSEHRLDLSFDDKHHVREISCYVNTNHFVPDSTCLVNGVQMLDTEDVVMKKLGKPDKTNIDNLVKSMTYKKYGMTVYLEKKMVYYIVITN